MFNKHETARDACRLFGKQARCDYEVPNGEKHHNRLRNGGNGHGTVRLYHRGRLVDEILCENVGCEYGEYGV